MKNLLTLILACLCLSAVGQQKHIRVHILGDSTTEQQNQNLKDQRGWPQLLPDFFTADVEVINHGKSGTSSRTFYEERWWQNARKTIREGDYVVVQFGHNDEKHGGADGPIGTLASGSYREYLQKFADEIRALGAIPIFTTPVVRKMGGAGEQVGRRPAHDLGPEGDTTSMNYPHNMRQIAALNGCALIDMTRSTKALVDRMGFEDATRRVYNFGDGTHICAEGALLFSKLFVDEMRAKGILAEYIVPTPAIAIQPREVDFGQVFVGAEARQEIDLMKLVEEAKFSGFEVVAGDGVQVSDAEFGHYADRVSLPAAFDWVYYRRLYMKVSPATGGAIDTHIDVTADGKTYRIPVRASAVPYPDGEKVSVTYSLNGNEKPATQGPVAAIAHTLEGLRRASWNALGADGLGARLTPPITSRAEWLTLPDGAAWPADEIDVVSGRYAQFGITAAAGTTLQLERVVVNAGGGVNYRIQASLSPDFSDYFVLAEGGDKLLVRHEMALNRTLKADQTLYLRVYPWTGGDPAAQLVLSNISLSGQVEIGK